MALLRCDAAPVLTALRAAGLSPALSWAGTRFGGLLLTRIGLLGSEETSGVNCVDLVVPRSARFAQAILERALHTHLRGEPMRVVTPEDFILLKALSTRARDVEDGALVWRRMADDLDAALIAEEGGRLALELPDHDVAGRLAAMHAPDMHAPDRPA